MKSTEKGIVVTPSRSLGDIELVSKYEELCLDVIPPQHPTNRYQIRLGRRLTNEHKIKSFLAMDHKQHTANAASTIESHLSSGARYRSVEDGPPSICPARLAVSILVPI